MDSKQSMERETGSCQAGPVPTVNMSEGSSSINTHASSSEKETKLQGDQTISVKPEDSVMAAVTKGSDKMPCLPNASTDSSESRDNSVTGATTISSDGVQTGDQDPTLVAGQPEGSTSAVIDEATIRTSGDKAENIVASENVTAPASSPSDVPIVAEPSHSNAGVNRPAEASPIVAPDNQDKTEPTTGNNVYPSIVVNAAPVVISNASSSPMDATETGSGITSKSNVTNVQENESSEKRPGETTVNKASSVPAEAASTTQEMDTSENEAPVVTATDSSTKAEVTNTSEDKNTAAAVKSTSSAVQQIFSAYRDASGDEGASSDSSSDSDTNIVGGESSDSDDGVKPRQRGLPDPDREPVVFLKTKGELGFEDLPPIEDLKITLDERTQVIEVGKVSSIVGTLVVIQASPGSPALDMNSILFLEGRVSLGQIFETFGPVVSPFYSVRFNKVEEIEEKSIKVGASVYFAPSTPQYTQYVFLTQLQQMRGSDASWENNNEPPDRYLDYSDDEQERSAKARARGKEPKEADDPEPGTQLPGAIQPNKNKRKNKRKLPGQNGGQNQHPGTTNYKQQHVQNPFGNVQPSQGGATYRAPRGGGTHRAPFQHHRHQVAQGQPAWAQPQVMQQHPWGAPPPGYMQAPVHQPPPRFGEIPQFQGMHGGEGGRPSPCPSPTLGHSSPHMGMYTPPPVMGGHMYPPHMQAPRPPVMQLVDSRYVQNVAPPGHHVPGQFAPQPNPDAPLM